MKASTLCFWALFAVFLIATGFCDLDWQVTVYKYDICNLGEEWIYCPFFKLNWWVAYLLNIGRVVAGSLIFGYLVALIKRKGVVFCRT